MEKHNLSSEIIPDFLEQLCTKEIGTFLYVDCWNLNDLLTYNFDSSFLIYGNLLWRFIAFK